VETRTEENYRSYIRNHLLPRWGTTALGNITALAVTNWIKQLRRRHAASTVAGIVTVFSMTPSTNASSPSAQSAAGPSAAGAASSNPSQSNASGPPRNKSSGSPTKPNCSALTPTGYWSSQQAGPEPDGES